MAFPDGGLITETNRQYYAGSQGFQVTDVAGQTNFTFTFDTDLYLGSWDPNESAYALNNFKLYTSADGIDFTEYILEYTLFKNTIIFATAVPQYRYVVVQLKAIDGGDYGDRDAYGNTVEDNYGGYSYITLDDVINNFIVAYVGVNKLIPDVKRTDVLFHAKRGLQEFSYDVLKSVKSQELTVPHSLSVILPQDYVSYVKISWIDKQGVKHPIYPTSLTIDPSSTPIQSNNGQPIQSSYDENIDGTSITEERWKSVNNGRLINLINGVGNFGGDGYGDGWNNGYDYGYYGRRYGMDPQYANYNGTFTINDREGKISFSSNLIDMLIVLEYISDGLAYELDSKIPKMAEEAMYAHILHSIISTRANQPEYLVQRLKRERSAKLRNAKIRLSNIKLEEFTQVMRGKSKWIKH
jgi:hypothetical protein